jgi:histidine ammonia-lyase
LPTSESPWRTWINCNVVRSHAAGVGDPLARPEVRAMMLIRANVLAEGFSGIRPLVAQRLSGSR